MLNAASEFSGQGDVDRVVINYPFSIINLAVLVQFASGSVHHPTLR